MVRCLSLAPVNFTLPRFRAEVAHTYIPRVPGMKKLPTKPLINSLSVSYHQRPLGRIPWSRIRSLYLGEWVELYDPVWSSDTPYPIAARVRNHSRSRHELLRASSAYGRHGTAATRATESTASPYSPESVVLFVGASVPVRGAGGGTAWRAMVG